VITRLKLVILVLSVALIPAFLIGYLSFNRYKSSLERQRFFELNTILDFKSKQVEKFFASLKNDISQGYGSWNIRVNLPKLTKFAADPGNPEFINAKRLLDNKLQLKQKALGLLDVMLVSPQGQVVYVSTPEHFKSHFLISPVDPGGLSFKEGREKIYLTDIFSNSLHGGRLSIFLSAPLADEKGKFIGVIIFDIDTNPFYALIQETAGMGKTGETLIGKRIGNEILFLNRLRFDPESALKRKTTLGDKISIPIQRAALGEKGSGLSIDYRGKEVIAAWSSLPSLGWGIVTKMDEEEAFVEITELSRWLMFIFLAAIILSALTAIIISRVLADAYEKVKQEHIWYSTTLMSIGDAAIATDKESNIIFINKIAVNITGWQADEALGKPLKTIFNIQNEETGRPVESPVDIAMARGVIVGLANHTILINKSGAKVPIEDSAAPIKDSYGSIIGVVLIFRDVSERRGLEKEQVILAKQLVESNMKLEELALKDSHTGVYNHHYLKEALDSGLSRVERQNAPLSVIMMDIDYFKAVNDVYGHLFGDLVLKQLAGILTQTVRPYDTVIRYGGEEFIIVCSNTSRDEAVAAARRILERVRAANFGGESHTIKLKISMAVASFPEDSVSGEDLIKIADHILNMCKEAGGDRVCSSLDMGAKTGFITKSSDVEALKDKISKLTKRANQSVIEATLAFAKAIELKDHYTGEHVEKTVNYVAQICKGLGFSDERTELVKQAAMLHDLGKIGISEELLHKNSALTKEEFEEIKKHPLIAASIIRSIQALHPLLPAIVYHHERWDSSGYPYGLGDDKIPLEARIIAIADVYEALVSDRPYRKAYSKEEAVKIIKEGSGTQFDPAIVKVFLEVMDKK